MLLIMVVKMKVMIGWTKNDECWRMNDEGWWFQAVEGFLWLTDGQTNERTNGHLWIYVTFATEKWTLGIWI